MSWRSFKEHVRNNRVMCRITFTVLLACMVVAAWDAWATGVALWLWIYAILGAVYVPLTLVVWFLPDEDLTDQNSIV